MKKSILILALVFVALTSSIQAQTLTVLTNNTIVKMVKASLSDEIIIDEIELYKYKKVKTNSQRLINARKKSSNLF